MARKGNRSTAHRKSQPESASNVAGGQECFLGGSEMGERMRAFDWSKTPLGPAETWSPALRMMVRFLLANRFPLLLWWGPQYVSIYNDPYRPALGTKHPWALGQPVSECWKEIWHILQPLIDTPFQGGPATWNDDLFLEINRRGFVEETHFTIAYSPVPDEKVASGIGGVLATVHEITGKVVGNRRVMVLRDLGARSAAAKTAEEACDIAAKTLAAHSKDIPFALLYLVDPDRKTARLAGIAGVGAGERASPPTLSLESNEIGDSPWPLAEAMRSEAMETVTALASRLAGRIPPGPWTDPPHTAVVVPIQSNRAHCLTGFLVAGISARLQLDDSYRDFLNLVSTQIATSIANAREHEEEKKRAEALAEIDRAKTAFFSKVEPFNARELLARVAAHLDKARLRMQAEDSMRESTERLRAIYDNSPIDIALISLDGKFIDVNHAAVELHGFSSKEELMARDCFSLVADENRELVARSWQRVLEEGSINNLELIQVKKDGTKISTVVSANRLDDTDGKPVALVAMVQDITERKRAEEALRENRAKYQALTETTSDFIWEMDAQGRFTYCSPQIKALWGLSPSDMIGRTPFDLAPAEHRDGDAAAFMALAQSPRPFNGLERSTYDGQGRLIHIEINGVPFFDDAGKLLGFRGITRDITERKRAEEALQQANIELARSNKDLEQFAHVASHDLQEPLRTIRAFLDLLAKRSGGKLDEKDKQYFGFVTDGADRMQSLISGLLTYSRLSAKSLKIADVPLRQCAEEALSALGSSIQEAGAAFSLGDLPAVKADATWIAQVLQNLIANAVKFRRKDVRPEVSVTATHQGGEIVVCVQDNGIGIPPEQCEHVFEMFRRLHSREAYPGTGIGLTICKKVIERHGGRIWVESKVGQGSSFLFTLPLSSAPHRDGTAAQVFPAPRAAAALRSAADMQLALEEAKEEQRRAAQLYETVAWNLPNAAVHVMDRHFRYIFSGGGVQARLGLSHEGLLGKTIYDVLPPEALRIVEPHYRRVLQGQTVSYEAEMGGFVFQVTAVPLKGSGSEIERILVLSVDVTERKRAEEAQQRSEAELSFVLELSDALRQLDDPIQIQSTASRLLGERLRADRVFFGEIVVKDGIETCAIERDYHRPGVSSLTGRFPFREFSHTDYEDYRAGRTVCSPNVFADGREPSQSETYRALDISAYVGVPLVKGSELVSVLGVLQRQPRNWAPEEIRLAEQTVDRTWQAVQRARTEKALHESEERFRVIAASTPDHLLVQDRELRYTLVLNPQLGLTEKDMLGHTDYDILTREDADKLTAIKRRVIRTGEPVHLEAPLGAPGGEMGYFDGSYVPRLDAEGRPNGLIGYFRNVTQEKRAEAALRESENRERRRAVELATLLDAAPTPVFIAHDPECLHITGNRAADELLRNPRGGEASLGAPEETKPRHFKAVKDGGDLPVDKLPAQRAACGEVVRDFEFSLVFDDGVVRDVVGNAVPLLDETGHPRGSILVLADITDRKGAEAELSRMSGLLAEGQEIAHVGSFEYVAETRTTVWSEEEFRIYGLDPSGPSPAYAEMLAKCYFPEDAALLNETFSKAMSAGSVYELEHRIVRPSGEVRWIYDRAHPHFDKSGKLVRYVGATVDVTERRRAEEALRSAVQELERSNKQLEQFAYISAHDLQEPLRQVRAFASLLRERHADKLEGKSRQYLDFVHEGATRMSELVSGLLAYGRVRAPGDIAAPVQADAALDAALAGLRTTVQESQADITRDPLPAVAADPAHLEQLFQNLISNAVKFRRCSIKPRVHVGCRRDGPRLVFSVGDNGIGIEPQYYEKVFQIFQRLHTRDKYPGAGIGLAICRKIVEQYGGRIWIEPTPGGGSTFYFTWPQE